MRNGPFVSNKRLVVFGVVSALLLLTLATVQVALAGPSEAPNGSTVGTLPTAVPTNTPLPIPTSPPPPPPVLPDPTETPIPTATPVPPADATSTPVPTATPEGFIPAPDVAPPVTEAYDWFEPTEIDVPIFEPEPTATAVANPTATPVPPVGATATPIPTPTAIPTRAPKVALKVPARSMNVDGHPASGQITVKPVAASDLADTSSNSTPDNPALTFAGRSIEINVYGRTAISDADDITDDVGFNPPLEIGFDITDAEWDANGGMAGTYEVRFFSPSEGIWKVLDGTVDPFPPRRVTAYVAHLTSFGLFFEPAEQAPGAPDGGDYSIGIGGAGLIGLFGATLVIVGFYVRRKANARI